MGKTATPFGELAWDHSVRDLRDQGLSVTEDALAAATRDLLERAGQGPPEIPSPRRPRRRDRSAKVAARTEATGEPAWPRPAPPALPDPPDRPAAAPLDDEEEALADIVPLKIFDARREAKKWW
ncbi:hypothetical protein [Kitasatospora sp. NPDC054795]